MDLYSLYKTLDPPLASTGVLTYSVRDIDDAPSYLLGRDDSSRPVLLVQTQVPRQNLPAIKLKSFEAYFGIQCSLQDQTSGTTSTRLSIIVCPVQDDETIRFFLSVCTSLIGLIGLSPDSNSLWSAANRIASLFQKLTRPPTRSVNGLFGELLTIWRSVDPVAIAAMWRIGSQSRFDFTGESLRLDVKTTTGRVRSHVMSFEQANPPVKTLGVVASMFVEQVGIGVPLRTLVEDIERMLSARPDLLIKLQEQTAETLGASLRTALETQFDLALSIASFRLYLTTEIAAIRGSLPPGVSSVHFTSDFSMIEPVAPSTLSLELKEAYVLRGTENR